MMYLASTMWPWAEQMCKKCRRMEPISHLVPVTAENGNLIAWTCEWEHCDG